jgi:hypothetical protein
MKKKETQKEFEARVRAFFLKNGWRIKEVSDECVAGRMAGDETDTTKIGEKEMKAKAPHVLGELPKQFVPEKVPQADFKPGIGARLLENINLATALAAKDKAQKTPLTPWEKDWIRKHGPAAALEIVNERAIEFVREENDDE